MLEFLIVLFVIMSFDSIFNYSVSNAFNLSMCDTNLSANELRKREERLKRAPKRTLEKACS